MYGAMFIALSTVDIAQAVIASGTAFPLRSSTVIKVHSYLFKC